MTIPSDRSIAVVIATLGRPDALRVCLDSLVTQTVRPAEVIVVHCGSDSGTKALCEEDWGTRGLTVTYLAYPHMSAALQRDFAVRRTRHPLIMFSDDDMEFEPDWIEVLSGVLDKDPRAGAAMGCIVNQRMGESTGMWRAYRRIVAPPERATVAGAVIGALVFNGFPADTQEPITTEWIGGGVTLLRRDAYLSVNGFAPYFRGSSPGEDVDLGYRISRLWQMYYVPAARCLHHQSPSGRENTVRQQYLAMRSRYAFCRATMAMSAGPALLHLLLWVLFQTASELSQLRRGRWRHDFGRACWGRVRGAWSCIGWNPGHERFPEWHDTHAGA